MTQYDVEILQKIETLLGKKLDEYKDLDSKAALILTDSVVEATRIANMEMRQEATNQAGGQDDANDNPEKDSNAKAFGGGKKRPHTGSMHNKGFNRSFAKKR